LFARDTKENIQELHRSDELKDRTISATERTREMHTTNETPLETPERTTQRADAHPRRLCYLTVRSTNTKLPGVQSER
jgi:hypothetical protein